MKKSAKFITLLTSLFALSACDFDFIKIDNVKKIIDESGQTEESQSGSTSDEGEETSEESFEYMKAFATNVVVQMTGISESEVKYADYDAEDLTYYPDVYTYNKDGLMFVSADLEIEDKDFLTTISELKTFIPSDATYDTNYSSEIDTDYGECDLYYKSGNYYYIVYAEDWSDVVYAKFDIVPVSQVEAYREKAYNNGDDFDWGDNDLDDMTDEEWEEFLNSLGNDE